jgi:arylsulfatase A-like enzyme
MIDDRLAEPNPFFLRIDVVEPHFECTPPEPFASLVDPKSIPPWPNFEETFEGKPMSHLRKHREWHLEEYDWKWWSKVVAKYYGVISYVDECFGRLLEGLEERGLSDNTIVVFSTDHGDAMGSHKHFEKAGTLYDEVYRVPLIMGGPKRWIQTGGREEFVRLLDLAPTFAEWADTKFTAPIDGLSVAPLAAGKTPAEWPDSVYAEYHGEVWGYNSQRMVRTQDWKYGFEPNGLDELYDLQNDPHEMVNLIDEPEHSATVTEMRSRLHGWIDATADQFTWPWVKMNLPDPIMPRGITARLNRD